MNSIFVFTIYRLLHFTVFHSQWRFSNVITRRYDEVIFSLWNVLSFLQYTDYFISLCSIRNDDLLTSLRGGNDEVIFSLWNVLSFLQYTDCFIPLCFIRNDDLLTSLRGGNDEVIFIFWILFSFYDTQITSFHFVPSAMTIF